VDLGVLNQDKAKHKEKHLKKTSDMSFSQPTTVCFLLVVFAGIFFESFLFQVVSRLHAELQHDAAKNQFLLHIKVATKKSCFVFVFKPSFYQGKNGVTIPNDDTRLEKGTTVNLGTFYNEKERCYLIDFREQIVKIVTRE
jgi:hypothetical protein